MQPLPIDAHLPDLVAKAKASKGLVLVAEPGAGKTTRVPRALLDASVASAGEILVAEPRRIAARMAAKRVAEELGEAVGRTIGYRVRFDSAVSRDTRVTFVTEGVLARRFQSDPSLSGVAALVFDELHERHLDTDLALARARRLRDTSRPELILVAMSATLEAEPVGAFLDAPIVHVEGRTFPIELRHTEQPDDRPLERQVRAAVVRLLDEGVGGDLLVFLPGAREIRRAMEACEGPAKAHGVDLVPLHGDLPADAQDRAVRPGPRPKVIFSTNVAETSLTIDGVVAVIDSGLARVARHSPWTGMQSLLTAPISRASAAQRAGRAGRTRAGICVRLYTSREHDARPLRDAPEVQRADLAEAALGLLAAGEDPRAFPWFETPPEAALDAAMSLLEKLGAAEEGAITRLGEHLVALPAHPRVARIAIEAKRRGFEEAGAALAALVAEREIRLASRTRFGHGSGPRDDEVGASDLLARLDELEAAGPRPSHGSLRHAGLDGRAVRTVIEAKRQLERALRRRDVEVEPGFDEEEALLVATLAGFPDRVARRRKEGGRELALAGGGATLDEASVVKDAALMVAVEAQEHAGRTFVRQASAVSLEHLMELFLDRLEDHVGARFDPKLERIFGVRELTFDGLVVERGDAEIDDATAAQALATAALQKGVGRFCDADALEALTLRLRFAREHDERLPTIDDAWLEALLVKLCAGRRSFAELRDAGLLDWIRAELTPHRARLDALAPEHVAIPGRARVPVTYEVDRPPWIASRLQDFFSAAEGPKVADGRQPLVLHLLAPNRRAVQVTTDLAGFWERHYPEIQRELRRRYPRHAWPDDPLSAPPSRPGRGRGRR